MKRCCTCKLDKDIVCFGKGQFRCKECQSIVCAKIRSTHKTLVFEHYGRSCKCCGEIEQVFLTIDHINGGGNQHRKSVTGNMYSWLVSKQFPEGFQTLCFNCNWAKHKLGICPHQNVISINNRKSGT